MTLKIHIHSQIPLPIKLMEDLALDFDEMITKTERHINHLKRRVQTLASIIAIKESQKALSKQKTLRELSKYSG